MEHLAGSVAATNRVTRLDAAVDDRGRILALDWDQIEDCGAHLRAPEPATLYRMHGNMTGAYAIRHVAHPQPCRASPTSCRPGSNRGFGGPQVYFPLERLIARIAATLGLDPLDVIRRNLVPADAFPYRTATGALLDSGDYPSALAAAAARRRPRRPARQARRGPRRGTPLRHRLRRGGRAVASPTWATSRPC